MTEDDDGHVKIGLKDVYQMVQGVQQTMADSFSALNLTMVSIKNHMETIDGRNLAADEIHKDYGLRIRKLEDNQISEDAVKSNRNRATAAIWASVAAIAAAAGTLIAAISHFKR